MKSKMGLKICVDIAVTAVTPPSWCFWDWPPSPAGSLKWLGRKGERT